MKIRDQKLTQCWRQFAVNYNEIFWLKVDLNNYNQSKYVTDQSSLNSTSGRLTCVNKIADERSGTWVVIQYMKYVPGIIPNTNRNWFYSWYQMRQSGVGMTADEIKTSFTFDSK